MTNFFLAVFGGFACLFPLAFYCLVLASVNRRRRPLLVTGTADFAGVLLATAGFLIVGGPLILVGLHDVWRRQALRGSLAAIREALVASSSPWLPIWAGYFVLVVGGSAWLLLRHRRVSVVYNIHPADAADLVPAVLDRLAMPWDRRGGTYDINFAVSPMTLRIVPYGRAILHVTIVPAMRHMTLRWAYVTGDVRRHIEAELRQSLAGLGAPDNPFAGWLLTVATGLFSLLLVLLGFFVYVVSRFGG